MTRLATLAVIGVMAATSTASAEPVRRGFLIGLSMGGGGTNACSECEGTGGPFAELHIGGWLTPRVALTYEAWVFTGNPQKIDDMVGQGFGLAVATLRVGERWWVKGGGGLALYESSHPITDGLLGMDTTYEYKGAGVGTAVGYELHQSNGSFVIDVSARLAASVFRQHGGGVSGSIGLGVTWN